MNTWRRRFGALVIGTLLVAALVVSQNARAGDSVPFKGSGTMTIQNKDFVNRKFYFSLVGQSTHMGRISGTVVVDMEFEPQPHPVHGEWHIVAANGDTLEMETYPGEKRYEIRGGTGRFAGATGSGSIASSGHGTVDVWWSGTIAYKRN